MTRRQCYRCNNEKPLEAFPKTGNGRRRRDCKECGKMASHAPVMEGAKTCSRCNQEKLVAEFNKHKRFRDGRNTICKLCDTALACARQSANMDDAYRQRHAKWKKNWRVKNVETYAPQHRASVKRRRAAKLGGGGTHTEAEWLALVKRFRSKCVCCGKKGTAKTLTRDHVVPLGKQGGDAISNIQPLCLSCNASKGNRHSTDYRMTPFVRLGQQALLG